LGYRSGPRGLALPVGQFEFTREEKLRLDRPLLAKVDSVEARILDKQGQPLKHRVNAAVQEGGEGAHAIAEMALSPFGRGDYVVEVAAKGGALTETKVVAFRMK